MKANLEAIILRIFNKLFSCKLELDHIEFIRLLCKEKIFFKQDDVEAIKLVIQEGLRINDDNVASIGLVIKEELRIEENNIAPIGLLIKEELHINENNVASIRLVVQEDLRITSRNVGPIKVLIDGVTKDSVFGTRLSVELFRQLDKIVLLNRLGDIADLSEGIQLCYSQEGESLILDRFFDFRTQGFYVDVGAHHPKRFSNTYSAYKRGWRGINIDPTPGVKELFDEIRPDDMSFSLAISNVEGIQDFYLFSEPALNTFSKSLADEYQQLGYELIEVRPIESKKLATLFYECRIEKKIDFMSIDVEDHELQVLQSNDWSAFRPAVLLVEILNFDMLQADSYPVHSFIIDKGYVLFARTYNTLFYKDVT
ncbi:FkbM family methyltransferase [Methylomonas sp. MK1]|uniref:FkbM family methyltransferase n=1 Tax=Methylomonas sp. MK1 TaxID=1131552 RepID=UPI00036D8752|nr:FkbM family methyltransferase [Methylomonas sp. MK1]